MQASHERLIALGTHILQASRNTLYLSMRFLDLALSSLRYEMTLEAPCVGTDGEKILFHTGYLTDRYVSDPVLVHRLYLHMVLHCLLRHPFRQNGRDRALWHLACDIAVEAIIDSLPYRCVKLTVSDSRAELYAELQQALPVLNAEAIYAALEKKGLSEKAFGTLELAFWVDDHRFWRAQEENKSHDDTKNNDSSTDETSPQENEETEQIRRLADSWKAVSERMQTDLETFSKDIGQEAGALLEQIRVENRKRYSYRRFLEKFTSFQEEMIVDDDAFDYIFYTYGLQTYGNLPLLEPLEYREGKKIEEMVIAIDTSESCEGEAIRRFLEETYGILATKESFFANARIHILQCDTAVRSDTLITSLQDLERFMAQVSVTGGGGTDFRPVFSYIADQIAQNRLTRLKGLLYFTDGYGIFPKEKPPYDTAFLFYSENFYDYDVPPWAIKLVFGRNDLLQA